MKDYIVAFEKSDVRSRAVVMANFDTFEEVVENSWATTDEILVCKHQRTNRWWLYDNGWTYQENEAITKAKANVVWGHQKAHKLITRATRIETRLKKQRNAGCVEYFLMRAFATEHRAHAQRINAQMERRLLETVLEVHGDIEWPMTD